MWWLSSKESACQHRKCGFDPRIGNISWRRKWQPTPEFLPGRLQAMKTPRIIYYLATKQQQQQQQKVQRNINHLKSISLMWWHLSNSIFLSAFSISIKKTAYYITSIVHKQLFHRLLQII